MSHAWLFVAGAVASIVNAAAGGGTLLSFPALIAAGLAPLQANATSAVALQAGLLTSTWEYRDKLTQMRGDVLRLLPPCFAGGVLGALAALRMGPRVFAAVVPFLLVAGAAAILLQPLAARRFEKHLALHDRPAAFTVVCFVIALYCGYFGAGGGILFFAALALLLRRPLDEVNALKVLSMPASNGIGALTFIALEVAHPSGVVVWRAVPLMAAGALIGGVLGVRVAKRLPALVLRVLTGAIGFAMAIYILLK